MPLILLVDDDKDFRKIYSRYLVEDGYEVLEAADGEQALRPSVVEPDLILLDMRMPDINGLELLPKLRDLHPRAKIIVASSYDTSFQKDLISGAEGYFDKSDGCQALSKAIRALLFPAERPAPVRASQAPAVKAAADGGSALRDPEVRRFVHQLAHDLRGPVGKIITIGELLSERLKAIEPGERKYLDRMNEASRQLKNMIDDWAKKTDV